MKLAMVTGCAVVCSASSLLAQASFSAYFCSGGVLTALSGDGNSMVVSVFSGGVTAPPTESSRIFSRDGTTMNLYAGGGRASVSGLTYDGSVTWGTTDALGGSVRKVTGPDAVDSAAYFTGYATDVSDDGHAVVGRTGNRAFIWDPAAGPTPLLLLPLSGGTTSWAEGGVSPNGQFVAGLTNTPTRATRWAASSGWAPMELAVPAGFTSATANAVSSTGLTVGIATGLAAHPNWEYPVVWDNVGNPRMLPIAGGQGEARAISGDGSVIVGFETTQSFPSSIITLVVWRNGVREDVVQLLADAGVSTSNARFDYASEVSTDGKVIAARGVISGVGTVACFIELPPACVPDVGSAGGLPGKDGVLDNNDFIAFIDFYFASDARADLGVAGGLRGADGVFDNNDFIAFIDAFFLAC